MKSAGLIAKITMYALMALSLIFIALSFTETDMLPSEVDGSYTSLVIDWTILVLGVGVIAAIASVVIGIISNSSNLLRSAIVVVGTAILVAVCWALSDGTPLPMVGYEGSENCYPWLNITDTGIFIFYVVGVIAVLSIIVTEIYHLFK